jgi:hypothetical protein
MKKLTPTAVQPAAPHHGRHLARCPFCDSTNTRKESDFGTTLAYAQYYCNDCRTMFEWLKWEEIPDDRQLPDFLKSR